MAQGKQSPLKMILLLGGLTALDPLTTDMYLSAFDVISQEFKTTYSMVEISISLFFVGMGLGQFFYGRISDKYGRKRPLVAGLAIYFIATIGCYHAQSIESFILFRFIQALGGCAGMVLTRAIIRDMYEKEEGAVFLSNMALVMGLAPIVAPSIGAYITSSFGWRNIFLLLGSLNAICLIFVLFGLPETNKQVKASMRLMIDKNSIQAILKDPIFVGNVVTDIGFRAGMFAYIAGSPFVFMKIFNIPSSQYGFYFGLNGIGLILAAQLNRYLLRRFESRQILDKVVLLTFISALFIFVIGFFEMKYVFLPILFIYIASLNLISPNTLANGLHGQSEQAGLASAFYGAGMWLFAGVAAFFVSQLHNGTALPMTLTILFFATLSFLTYKLFLKKHMLQNEKSLI